MNAYEERQEARRERLEDAAAKARGEAGRLYQQARTMASAIPFGQPILADHYSATRDRNYRNRIHNTYGKAFAANDRAQDLERRAEAVGTAGISADDQDAPAKLRERIAELESSQERMKAANVAIRKHAKAGEAEQVAALIDLGYAEAQAGRLLKPDFCGRVGFPDYALQNNSSNLRRLKQRLASLEARAAEPVVEQEAHGDVTLVRNVELNRLQLIFPRKPNDVTRTLLKSQGFRWSPREGAWQRQLNNAAEFAAKYVLGVAA